MYALFKVALSPSRPVTVTGTVPVDCGGTKNVTALLLLTTTFVAKLPPTLTVAILSKPVPYTVRVVPPSGPPQFGETDDTIGGERKV